MEMFKALLCKMVQRLPFAIVIKWWIIYMYASNEMKSEQICKLFIIQNIFYTYITIYCWNKPDAQLYNLGKLVEFYVQENQVNIASYSAALCLIGIYVTTLSLYENSFGNKAIYCSNMHNSDKSMLLAVRLMLYISISLCLLHAATIFHKLWCAILDNYDNTKMKEKKIQRIIKNFQLIVLETDFECPICYETNKINYVKLDCNHIFHKNCCAEWFHRSLTCPTCRKECN